MTTHCFRASTTRAQDASSSSCSDCTKMIWLTMSCHRMTVLSFPAIAEEDEPVPWDTASKTSDLNDYSVCTTWSVERDKYYLLNAIRRRLNYPDLKRAIVAHAKEYGSPTVVIEDKSSGTQLIQDLRNEGVLSVIDYKPPSGADVFTPAATGSRTAAFCLPASAPPLDDYITELVGFPGVKHDD